MTAIASGIRRSATLSGLSDGAFLLAVCAVNILLRVPLLLIEVTPTSDFGWYYARAQDIAAGRGFAEDGVLTAFWPVGWPGFLGGLLSLFGPHVLVGQVANLVLSTAVVGLMAAIGMRLFAGSASWRVAVLIIAVLPNQIAYVPLLSVEIFFEFLLLLGFLLLMSPSTVAVLAAGLVFGVAALTKSQAVLLPVVLGLPLLLLPTQGHADTRWRWLRQWIRTMVLAGIGMLVVMLPWTARNYAVFHTLIPVSTNGGYTLLTGNNSSARGGYMPDDPLVADLSKDPRDQVEMDRIAKQRAWQWIGQNPGRFVKLIPAKIWFLWSGDGEAEWLYQSGYAGYGTYYLLFRAIRVLNQVVYVVLLGLAAASLPPLLRLRRSLPPWCFSGWAAIGYFTAISVVFSGQSRFHFALMPFIALYAAWRVTSGGGWMRDTAA